MKVRRVLNLINQLNLKYRIVSLWILIDAKLHLPKIEESITSKNFKIPLPKSFVYDLEHINEIINGIYSEPTDLKLDLDCPKEAAQKIVTLFTSRYLEAENKSDLQSIKYIVPQIKGSRKKTKVTKNIISDFTDELNFNQGPIKNLVNEIFTLIAKSNLDLTTLWKRKPYLGFIPMPSTIHYLYYLFENCKIIINDIPKFSKKYGIKYNHDGEIRCFYNSMNICMHYFFIHGRSHLTYKERKVIFALSALHPTQDDLIDNEDFTANDMNIIDECINEAPTNNVPKHLKPIANLIQQIYKHFPSKKHPFLKYIIKELQFWQLESVKQKREKKTLSKEELLKISCMKGGYAFAFYGYAFQSSMSVSQFIHYFAMGAVFQLMDDFHDIDEDIENKTLTVFTDAVFRRQSIDKPFLSIIGMQKGFEVNIPKSPDFKYPSLIRLIQIIGARYDSLRFFCMNKTRFSNELSETVSEQLSIDLTTVLNFFSTTKSHETLEQYMQVINDVEKRIKRQIRG